VVDDNATNRRVMEQMLDSWGCRYDGAPEAQSALEKLQAAVEEGDPFRIAILDMAMPGTDGATLGRTIKQEAGMDDYVPKPVEPAGLANTIRKWISVGRTRTAEPVNAEPVQAGRVEEEPVEQAPASTPAQPGARPHRAATPQPEPDGPHGMLDTDGFLNRCDGDIEFAQELVELFLDTYPTQLSRIRQAVDRRDRTALERAAHAFKSSVGNLCANAAMEAALRLEMIGRGGDIAEADEAMAALDSEIARLKPALATLAKGHQLVEATKHGNDVPKTRETDPARHTATSKSDL